MCVPQILKFKEGSYLEKETNHIRTYSGCVICFHNFPIFVGRGKDGKVDGSRVCLSRNSCQGKFYPEGCGWCLKIYYRHEKPLCNRMV